MKQPDMERITATEAARNFSDLLNRVKYQGARFEITRGNDVVAHILPATASAPGTIEDLLRVLDSGPGLEPGDAERWAGEVEAMRRDMKVPDTQWE